MGRETVAVCHWQGDICEARLHLDSNALSLRGALRVDIPRTEIRDARPCDEGLRILTERSALVIECSATEAARWQKAVLKRSPTLAEKLGVSAETPGFLLGACPDDALATALQGAVVAHAADATILLAIIMDHSDLRQASDLAQAHPGKHIWMIHRKGKAAQVGDTMIRTHMRNLGFIDSKTSAVSDQLTTTRYRMRT